MARVELCVDRVETGFGIDGVEPFGMGLHTRHNDGKWILLGGAKIEHIAQQNRLDKRQSQPRINTSSVWLT